MIGRRLHAEKFLVLGYALKIGNRARHPDTKGIDSVLDARSLCFEVRLQRRNIGEELRTDALKFFNFSTDGHAHLGSFGLCGEFERFDTLPTCDLCGLENRTGPFSGFITSSVGLSGDRGVEALHLCLGLREFCFHRCPSRRCLLLGFTHHRRRLGVCLATDSFAIARSFGANLLGFSIGSFTNACRFCSCSVDHLGCRGLGFLLSFISETLSEQQSSPQCSFGLATTGAICDLLFEVRNARSVCFAFLLNDR